MFEIKSIPAFNDNYIWCLINANKQAYVVDPGSADAVINFIESNELNLLGIFITHHHHDHIGGIESLQKYCQNTLTVYGPKSNFIPQITHQVSHNDELTIPSLIEKVKVLEIPGHTLDHIAYYINGHLFCGDTLFSAGCGRLFEGTPNQMHTSLALLSQLPKSTKVYPAHEYTLSNLKFADCVEPNSTELNQYIAYCTELRNSNTPTLPTTIETELKINPFLRVNEPVIINELKKQYPNTLQNDAVTRFAALRKWKDNF